MSSFNVFVNYKGFEPSIEDKSFLKLKLGQLKDLCPSTSTLTVDFIKECDRFFGVEKIFFGETPFSAVSDNADFRSLILELNRKLQDELISWKKERFTDTVAI